MSPVRRIARPLLSAMFLAGGLDQLRHPSAKLEKARPFVERWHEPLHLPNDPEMLVRANGAAMVGAGSLLALGRFPRLAGLVLAATLVPTTWAGHAFWAEEDPKARAMQRTQFLKNAGILGGLLLVVVDTDGKPGLSWRTRRAGRDAQRAAKLAGAAAKREAKLAAHEAKRETKLAKARIEAHSPL